MIWSNTDRQAISGTYASFAFSCPVDWQMAILDGRRLGRGNGKVTELILCLVASLADVATQRELMRFIFNVVGHQG